MTLEAFIAGHSALVTRMSADDQLRYASFGLVAVGIELLGACRDDEDFHATNRGLCEERFGRGIDLYMSPVDARYGQFNRTGCAHRLYKNLRCGMSHVMRPAGRIGFTSRGESLQDGTEHLGLRHGSGQSLLVLVAEQFADDFALACHALLAELPTLRTCHPKLAPDFLRIG
jgi:hypothetical protein